MGFYGMQLFRFCEQPLVSPLQSHSCHVDSLSTYWKWFINILYHSIWTTSFNIKKNSRLIYCLHCIYLPRMFSEWTVIISLKSINRLIFVIKTVCVLCGQAWVLQSEAVCRAPGCVIIYWNQWRQGAANMLFLLQMKVLGAIHPLLLVKLHVHLTPMLEFSRLQCQTWKEDHPLIHQVGCISNLQFASNVQMYWSIAKLSICTASDFWNTVRIMWSYWYYVCHVGDQFLNTTKLSLRLKRIELHD